MMDLLRPVSPEAADAPPILRRDFRHSPLAAYRPAEVRTQLRAAGLGRVEVEAVSDRHLLVWGTR